MKPVSAKPIFVAVGRGLRRGLVFIALCYLGVIVVLLALENSLVYHPASAAESWDDRPAAEVQDVYLTGANGERLHAWWWPGESGDALLYCHGNGGNLSHRGPMLTQIRETLGVSVLIFDYPGYGKSGGSPSEAGCYAAADAAYNWLVQQAKIDPKRILLYGDSLGGGVAVDLASRKPHRALVVVKTFTSAPAVAGAIYPWIPVRWLMRNRFDNLAKIKKCTQPVFIAHGSADRLIAFEQGKQLYEAANMPKQFFPMPGVGHNDAMPLDMLLQLRSFISETEPSVAALGVP